VKASLNYRDFPTEKPSFRISLEAVIHHNEEWVVRFEIDACVFEARESGLFAQT
jgi:hypothetical protein